MADHEGSPADHEGSLANQEAELAAATALARTVEAEVARVIAGQREIVRQVVSALLAGGHVLLEGAPGIGKTSLVRALAGALDLRFSRIQFTPDLMPADIVGTHLLVDEPGAGRRLAFRPGPVFANVVLADEINRATPKTQSALLEAMQEGTVTVGEETHPLPSPFFVLATQNPIEHEGTYPLPEAQLDRFFFKVLVPYPGADDLHEILRRTTGAEAPEVARVADGGALLAAQRAARRIPIAHAVADYAVRIVLATQPDAPGADERVRRLVRYGASPRGLQALVLAGKVRALLDGRLNVAFDDIAAVALPALRHRIGLRFEAEAEGVTADAIIQHILEGVPR